MKKLLSCVLSIGLIASLTACGGGSAAPATTAAPAATTAAAAAPAAAETTAAAAEAASTDAKPALKEFTRLTLSSASIGGALYTWGAAMGSVLSENVENLELTNEASNGPAANLGLVSSGQTDIGVVTDSVAYEALHGTGAYEGKPITNISTMFVGYPSALQIFTTKESGITTVEDLQGKRIGFGPSGSSGDLIGHDILGVLGISAGQETFLGWTDTIDNLKDGLIDACVDVGGFPHASRQELEATNEVVYIELSDDQLKQVNEKFPYYKIGQIPQETYKYLTKDYNTVQIWYDVLCAPDMDEDTVYNIVKGAYGSVDSLAQVSSLAQFLYPENLEFCSVPLHKGAVKFYQEAGVEIPAELMPQ